MAYLQSIYLSMSLLQQRMVPQTMTLSKVLH